jgi:hypothetical protein
VEALWHPTIRRGPPPPFIVNGVRSVPPIMDPLDLLPGEKRREIRARTAGMNSANVDWVEHRGDREWLVAKLKSSGDWDRKQLGFLNRPMGRPPCLESCIEDLMWYAWLGMDVEPILAARTPPTTELDWWTAMYFRLVRAASGDQGAIESIAGDAGLITDPQRRRTMLVHLVNLPPALEIHPKIRPLVVQAAREANDPDLRRYAIELLASPTSWSGSSCERRPGSVNRRSRGRATRRSRAAPRCARARDRRSA